MKTLEEFLERLEELEKKATPGPWTAKDCSVQNCWCGYIECLPENFSEGKIRDWIVGTGEMRLADCAFTAQARNALPKLLKVVRVLKEGLSYYGSVQRWESTTHESTRDGIGCGDFETRKLEIGSGYEQVGGKHAREALAEAERIIEG